MSYDFDVFLGREPRLRELGAVLDGIPGLAIADSFADVWQVVRGPRGKHSFSLDLPVRVKTEDLPEGISAAMFAPVSYIAISANGADEREIAAARRAAKALADGFEGVALDRQNDEIWPRSSRRKVAKPERNSIVSLVEFSWFLPASRVSPDLIQNWLELCRRDVPEALPRRYGSFEPLQGMLADGGQEQFLREWELAEDTISFAGSLPVTGGSLPVGRERRRGQARIVKAVEVSVLLSAFDDPRWTSGFRRLFVDFAERSESVYAYGEVARGYEWSGRQPWFSLSHTERTSYPNRGEWLGLLPYPTFWSWYGNAYRPYLEGSVLPGTTEALNGGLFNELSAQPADRDELFALAVSDSARPRSGWIPRSLQLNLLPNPEGLYPDPMAPAQTIPEALRVTPARPAS
ncbi:hypothetical protein ABH923_003921 [Leifsonia sp. EB41]|uniref:hypothetical protein n=1 Tax=Leifsonia sp. EB41 TaxID=3156260 RepID=UPI00351598EB